jgi:hypothetical protein
MSSLLAEAEFLEGSLWDALRTLEERLLLLRHLALHAREGDEAALAEAAERRARDLEQAMGVIRDLITRQETLSEGGLRQQGRV